MLAIRPAKKSFTLAYGGKNAFVSGVAPPLLNALERLLGLQSINALYRSVPDAHTPAAFASNVLRCLDVRYTIEEEDRARIPTTGPLVIVANHPFGGIEGIVMASAFIEARPDLRIMANYLLGLIPELRDLFLLVDPFHGEGSVQGNLKPMREALSLLHNGGALGVFPAGEVSQLNHKRGIIEDPAWSTSVAGLIRHTKATALPVYFEGGNGPLFHALGMLHPRLRTAMLARELANKRGKTIRLSIGRPIGYERLARFSSDEEMIAYLRFRTYVQGARESGVRNVASQAKICPPKPIVVPIVLPGHSGRIENEVRLLPASRLLTKHEGMAVYYAEAERIPFLFHEIGRLRETTFRLAGEGTGKAIDIDEYDAYYLHLFVWNENTREVVAAYRLGRTDVIQRERGVAGLYTSSLFAYSESLLQQIGPALEMGRSFVRPEYQRRYSSLMLLWKGIGAFVARHPQYRTLFGPVSINSAYSSTSRLLLMSFLRMNNYLPDLARLVRPRTPPTQPAMRGIDLHATSKAVEGVDELSSIIADIERDGKEIPVLLRQYLKLGGKLLGFNVDSQFSDVLDGLILVDLLKTDRRILAKYMGAEKMRSFLAQHGVYETPTYADIAYSPAVA